MMVTLKKFAAPALATLAMVFGAASAHALEAGQCGPIADMGGKLSQEGQSAFGKGRRLSTLQEQKAMNITRPVSFGLIYFMNAQKTLGYIAKTEVPLESGPTEMCIDHVIGNVQLSDARTVTTSAAFEKSNILKEFLKILATQPLSERVMFQADSMRMTAQGPQPDGTIITATANMVEGSARKGQGTILFTNASTGGTSKIYDAAGLDYTRGGLNMLGSLMAGEVPKKKLN